MSNINSNYIYHSEVLSVKHDRIRKRLLIDVPEKITKAIEFEPQMKIMYFYPDSKVKNVKSDHESYKVLVVPNRRKLDSNIIRLKFSVSDKIGSLSILAYILYDRLKMNILVSHLVSTNPGLDAIWIVEAELEKAKSINKDQVQKIIDETVSIPNVENETSINALSSKDSIKVLSIDEIDLNSNLKNFCKSTTEDEITRTISGNNRIVFKDDIYLNVTRSIKNPIFAIAYANENDGGLLIRFLRTDKLLKINFKIKDEPGVIYKITHHMKEKKLDIKHAFSNMLNYKTYGNYLTLYVDYELLLKNSGGTKESKIEEIKTFLADMKTAQSFIGYSNEKVENPFNEILETPPELNVLQNNEKDFVSTAEKLTNYLSTQKYFWILFLIGLLFSFSDSYITIPEQSNNIPSIIVYFFIKCAIYVPIFIGVPQLCKSILNLKKWL
ncbi:membrane protein [Candidatus Magnetomorum sp. HK-1]|nr:membrane protein [Candidatus Magnetomorum sp. HK-1]